MAQIYFSRIDTWLALLLTGVVVLCVAITLLSIPRGTTAVLASLPSLLIGAGLPVWLFINTSYTLTDSSLLVRSGPFRWTVPVAEITKVMPTNSVLSSPALSLDRLRIEYSRGKVVMISPKLKEEFLQDLNARRRKAGAKVHAA